MPSSLPDPTALARLLGPVPIEDFLDEYAGKKALLIPGDPDRFADLKFDREAFFRAAGRFEADAGRLKAAPATAGEVESYVPAEPAQLRSLYAQGLTVCCAGISDKAPRLAAFAEGVRYAMSVPDLRFNSYLSPAGMGFNLHYDAQPIFLLQMEGRKRWWYASGPISPPPNCYSSAWDDKPRLDSLKTTTLNPGDVLYLPAFTWHRARAEAFSLGITLGVKGHHNQPLRRTLSGSALFGEWPLGSLQPFLAPTSTKTDEPPPAARRYLEDQLEALRERVSNVTVADLWRAWIDEVHEPKGQTALRRDAEFFSQQRLALNLGLPMQVSRVAGPGGAPKLRVSHSGRHLVLAADCELLVHWIADQSEPFDLAQASASVAGLTRTEVKRVLRELLALDVLRTCD